MGRTRQTLTVADIVEINRRIIAEFGGIFLAGDNNLANPGSLEHALEEIQGSLFGQELYPTIIEKAAVLGWRIIANHVFHDGNKRTGMEVCYLFLRLNDYEMRIARDVIDTEIVDMALAIATDKVQLDEFARWLEQRTTKID
jgi:death on curing protein